jgi:hypothetical protein
MATAIMVGTAVADTTTVGTGDAVIGGMVTEGQGCEPAPLFDTRRERLLSRLTRSVGKAVLARRMFNDGRSDHAVTPDLSD